MNRHGHVPDLCISSPDRSPVTTRSGGGSRLDSTTLAQPVLIIEDEAIIAWMLESLLEEMGFSQIEIASSGADAIKQAKLTAPALILSDINLGAGEMDGIAATATVAGTASVVFMTAFASAEARQRIARDIPGAVLLRKPVEQADLRKAILAVSERGGLQ